MFSLPIFSHLFIWATSLMHISTVLPLEACMYNKMSHSCPSFYCTSLFPFSQVFFFLSSLQFYSHVKLYAKVLLYGRCWIFHHTGGFRVRLHILFSSSEVCEDIKGGQKEGSVINVLLKEYMEERVQKNGNASPSSALPPRSAVLPIVSPQAQTAALAW